MHHDGVKVYKRETKKISMECRRHKIQRRKIWLMERAHI